MPHNTNSSGWTGDPSPASWPQPWTIPAAPVGPGIVRYPIMPQGPTQADVDILRSEVAMLKATVDLLSARLVVLETQPRRE